MSTRQDIKVIDRKASDNEYMHKDFHGALCYAIKYLDDNYGHDATKEYLQQVARTYFVPLTEDLEAHGLKALEKHWQDIFSKEGGKCNISYEDNKLVLEVTQCPAIAHLKENNMLYTDRHCMTTAVVNETLCQDAGYACSCEYEPGEGKCIQRFWKE